MGGYGSGSYYRWCKKTTTEETKRIDIRYLKKQGLLRPNRTGSLSWTCGGEPSGDIRYKMFSDRMELNYRFRRNGGDWQPVEQTIWFDQTPCNFGGNRKWFICPHCHTRVAILYGADVEFSCRLCYGLAYSSQSEDYLDRMQRKADKIALRLDPDGLDDDYYYKPKGMHQQTFDRLITANNRLQEAIEGGFLYKFRHWMQL